MQYLFVHGIICNLDGRGIKKKVISYDMDNSNVYEYIL